MPILVVDKNGSVKPAAEIELPADLDYEGNNVWRIGHIRSTEPPRTRTARITDWQTKTLTAESSRLVSELTQLSPIFTDRPLSGTVFVTDGETTILKWGTMTKPVSEWITRTRKNIVTVYNTVPDHVTGEFTVSGCITELDYEKTKEITAWSCCEGPAIDVTMTWGGGGTRWWLASDDWIESDNVFSDGETKTLCPRIYNCATGGSPTNSHETWKIANTTGFDFLAESFYDTAASTMFENFYNTINISVSASGTTPLLETGSAYATAIDSTGTSGISGDITSMAFGGTCGFPIGDAAFGSISTAGGVTISWERHDASQWSC